MLRITRALTATVVVSTAIASAAHADEIFLKNGDRITGKIVSATGGKLVVAPDFAPNTQITLAQDDVVTFSAPEPVVLKLKDGTTLDQPVDKGPPGQVTIAAGGAMAARPVNLQQVDVINPPPPPPVAWHGTMAVNGLYSSASTSSLLLGASASGERKSPTDDLTAHATYNYGEQSTGGLTTTNAENWAAGAKYSLNFAPKIYGYTGVEAASDRVNFLNLRVTPSVGAGYRWFDAADFHLTTDAGLAWIYEDYSTTQEQSANSIAVTATYHIDRSWDANRFSVFHDLQVTPALQGDRVVATADAGLRTNFTKTLYTELRADVTYDSHPADGAKATTTQLKLGLGWTY